MGSSLFLIQCTVPHHSCFTSLKIQVMSDGCEWRPGSLSFRKLSFKTRCLCLSGLKLQGATCANNKLSLSTSISTELPLTQLRWVKQNNAEKRHVVRLNIWTLVIVHFMTVKKLKSAFVFFPTTGDAACVSELHQVWPHLHRWLWHRHQGRPSQLLWAWSCCSVHRINRHFYRLEYLKETKTTLNHFLPVAM